MDHQRDGRIDVGRASATGLEGLEGLTTGLWVLVLCGVIALGVMMLTMIGEY
jgi:hypothetical protein